MAQIADAKPKEGIYRLRTENLVRTRIVLCAAGAYRAYKEYIDMSGKERENDDDDVR